MGCSSPQVTCERTALSPVPAVSVCTMKGFVKSRLTSTGGPIKACRRSSEARIAVGVPLESIRVSFGKAIREGGGLSCKVCYESAVIAHEPEELA